VSSRMIWIIALLKLRLASMGAIFPRPALVVYRVWVELHHWEFSGVVRPSEVSQPLTLCRAASKIRS